MSSEWDLAIVGAGPAGTATAIAAARAGMKTVVLDAARFPRQKVCGEYLTPAAVHLLEDLGVADLRSHSISLTTMELSAGDDHRLSIPFAAGVRPDALSRHAMDARLIDEARRIGVTVLTGCRVRRVVVERGRAIAVECQADSDHDRGERFSARLIVAADGRQSIVVRDTGTLKRYDSGLFGFKRHVRTDGSPPPTVTMHALPDGYLGTCPVGAGELNCCGMMPVRRLRESRGDITAAFRAWTSDRTALRNCAADDDSPWSTIPDASRQSARPNVAGVLYVGDAFETIEPLAGQGMTLALASARMAVECVRRIGLDEMDESAQQTYAAAWRARFARPIRHASWFGRLLCRPRLLRGLITSARAWPGLSQGLFRTAHAGLLTVPDSVVVES